ncbi:MAG TPA: FAD-dependent oxidoreductase [Pseudomonadales bacterium]|nr:FAD-dependent oxidoreductase [Pseudomonadales bacterium]
MGAGVVGLATALQLQGEGCAVTLVDRLAPGTGTSRGNAGIFSTGSVHPEGMPGFWKEIPSLVLRRDAPVHLRPAYAPAFAPWLLRFLANTSAARAEQASQAISALSSIAMRDWDRLIAASGAEHLVVRRGVLYAWESAASLAAGIEDSTWRDRRGVAWEVLRGSELHEVEPALSPHLAGGIRIAGAAHTTSPLALSRALFAQFRQQGGRFEQAEVTDFERRAERITGVRLNGGTTLAADEVFVTAGAWSKDLARRLGSRVPLETERGYHIMVPSPGVSLRQAVLFPAHGFAATPMAEGLRLAGTVEFAGLRAAADPARAQLMLRLAQRLLPGVGEEGVDPWMGHRPSLPDSVPVISPSPQLANVWFGFGHGHLGLTQAAITGAMLAAMADGRPTPVPAAAYRIDRRW